MNFLSISTKKIIVSLLLINLFLSPISVFAEPEYILQLSVSEKSVFIEDNTKIIPTYSVNGNYYAHFATFANYSNCILEFDDELGVIKIDLGIPQKNEGQIDELLEFVKNPNRSVAYSTHKLFFQGNDLEIPFLNIDGFNFVSIDLLNNLFGYRTTITDNEIIFTKSNPQQYNPYLSNIDEMSDEELQIYKDYLNKNVIPFNFDTKELNGVDFDKYNVILIGESHEVSKNTDVRLFFIKYLYENYGIRYIINEEGYSDSMLLNKFLETGDISIAKKLVEVYESTFNYTKEIYDFYLDLYEYNKTLPEDKKLFFIGVDVQHNKQIGIEYLLSLFNDSENLPQPIKTDIEVLKNTYDKQKFAKTVLSIKENSEIYEKQLGKNYKNFRTGIENIV